jgi:transposase
LTETLIHPSLDGVRFLESFGPRRIQMPAEVRRQVIEPARSGPKIPQLAETFGMSDATIYTWLKQERIDCGEVPGPSTNEALDLAAARRRIKQLEAGLAVSRKVNEVFLEGDPPENGSSR